MKKYLLVKCCELEQMTRCVEQITTATNNLKQSKQQ